MHKILFLLTFLIISHSSNCQETDVVAKVGTKSVTKDEFLERYELAPLFRKHMKRLTPSLKLEFLYTLITEKLWAQQAEEIGLDTMYLMTFTSEAFQKMFVRDALYQREIKNKVVVSNDEIAEGMVRYASTLKVNFLFSEEKKEIDDLYRLLSLGIPFDTLLIVRNEYQEQKNPQEIVYGQMSEEIEDSLFNLKAGRFTSPILTPDGWYIFRLTNKIERFIGTPSSDDDNYKTVKEIVEARKMNKLLLEFYGKFFKDVKVDIDAELLKRISKLLADRFALKVDSYKLKEGEFINLEPDDILLIEQTFGFDQLKLPFILFEENPIGVQDYLRMLVFDGFKSKYTDVNSIFKQLNSKTKVMVEKELLAREGEKRGLQYTSEVKNSLKMWRDNYLFQFLQSKFADSAKVSDEEVYQEYLSSNKEVVTPMQVNIVEVFTDSLEVVEKVLKALEKGTNIKELAARYTQREWTKKQSGEFGFFPVFMHGEIGRIASQMEAGEIYGPLKIDGGYSIFKLIGKKDESREIPQAFDKVKDGIKLNIAYKKMEHAMNNYTIFLANKFGVGINLDLLKSIEVTNINTMAFRFLGFGGRMTAVPLLPPNVNWVEPWLESQRHLP